MITRGQNSELKYELIVGASHMDKDFSFALAPEDARVLSEDHERHAAFRNVLYFELQNMCFGENAVKDQEKLQTIFDEIAQKAIRSSTDDVASYLSNKGDAVNAAIKKDLEKLNLGQKYTAWGL